MDIGDDPVTVDVRHMRFSIGPVPRGKDSDPAVVVAGWMRYRNEGCPLLAVLHWRTDPKPTKTEGGVEIGNTAVPVEWEIELTHTLQRDAGRGVGDGWACRRGNSGKEQNTRKSDTHICKTVRDDEIDRLQLR